MAAAGAVGRHHVVCVCVCVCVCGLTSLKNASKSQVRCETLREKLTVLSPGQVAVSASQQQVVGLHPWKKKQPLVSAIGDF